MEECRIINAKTKVRTKYENLSQKKKPSMKTLYRALLWPEIWLQLMIKNQAS